MSEPLSLDTYLSLALAVGATIPFDSVAAFTLLSELEGVLDLRLPTFLNVALQGELDALDDADLYRSAIARAALSYLVVAIERKLSAGRADLRLVSGEGME